MADCTHRHYGDMVLTQLCEQYMEAGWAPDDAHQQAVEDSIFMDEYYLY